MKLADMLDILKSVFAADTEKVVMGCVVIEGHGWLILS